MRIFIPLVAKLHCYTVIWRYKFIQKWKKKQHKALSSSEQNLIDSDFVESHLSIYVDDHSLYSEMSFKYCSLYVCICCGYVIVLIKKKFNANQEI